MKSRTPLLATSTSLLALSSATASLSVTNGNSRHHQSRRRKVDGGGWFESTLTLAGGTVAEINSVHATYGSTVATGSPANGTTSPR